MKFFCPACSASIDSQGQAQQASCPGCGLEVDLGLASTDVGGPRLPLLADRTGDRIGPYRLDQGLGSGGMGAVYRATDTRDGTRVALKLLSPQLAAFPAIRARFQREAKALAELSHPRVVGYLDAGEQAGDHYLVMEYLEGRDLGAHLEDKAIWPAEAERIAAQICQALEAAHAQGIVHRDLKPANIFVTDDGVRVLDFGIAQLAGEDLTLTHTDAMLGTFNYMSPEQRARAGGVDHRSDLYSLGVMLYRMYTGQLPMGAFEPPSRLNPHLTGRHDRLVMRLLSADPERRPPNAAALRTEIEGLSARPARARKWALGLVALLGLGGLAWGGMLLLSDPPLAVESEKAAAPQAKPDKRAAKIDKPTKDPVPKDQPAIASTAPTDGPKDMGPKRDEKPAPEKKEPIGKVSSKKAAKTMSTRMKSPKITRSAKKRKKKRPRRTTYPFAVDPTIEGLREAPDPKAPPSGPIAKDLRVRRLIKAKGADGRLWVHIETSDGRTGYIPAKALQETK